MASALILDQPNLIAPESSRRLQFGSVDGDLVSILNGRGRAFEGGSEASHLSLKWMIAGSADYESAGRPFHLAGDRHLLLNCGEPYRLRFREASESFTVSFGRKLADAAWTSHVGSDAVLPEFPTVACKLPPRLDALLHALYDETRQAEPDGDYLIERAFALLSEIADLARQRRDLAGRVPAIRAATRAELLRRLARAEDYLLNARKPTLEDAAEAAALSPFHLIRVFRAVHSLTPLAFAARARLEAARNALLMTLDSIETIASRAGYESRSAFDRAFQRQFGTPPGTLRTRS